MKDCFAWLIIAFKILLWSLSLLVIYWIVLKLTGHSPTMIDIILALQMMTFTALVTLAIHQIRFNMKLSRHMGKVGHHMKESDRRFLALARDVKRCCKNILCV